jgi:integrative and conjugative element protein (TIGR02256 family)
MWRRPKPDVYISVSVLDSIRQECSRVSEVETGGILIGYHTKNCIVISDATGPGPHAIHRRDSLELDLGFISAELRRFETTLPVGYEGNWHSHPGQDCIAMSPRDKRLLRDVVCSPEYDVDAAVMVIVPEHPVRKSDFNVFLLAGCLSRIRRDTFYRCHPPFAKDS